MKCLGKYGFFVLLAFSFAFGIGLLNISGDVSAVSDLTYTIDSSNYTTSFYFCDTYANVSCGDYHYLLIETNVPLVSSSFSTLAYYQTPQVVYAYKTSGFGNTEIMPYRQFYTLPYLTYFEDLTSFRYVQISYLQNLRYSDWSVTITLSENNPYASGITPSGSLSITENGTYDVTQYAEAVVDVPTSSGGGGFDYSQKLDGVITAIYTCGAIVLVVYFFYCIYRMIIKTTGGK